MLLRLSFVACLGVMTLFSVGAKAQTSYPLTIEFVSGEEIQLLLQDLDAMDQVEFSTKTIWTDEDNRFSGVPLHAILNAVGAEGKTLRLSALNDYSVEMPVAELETDLPILATRIDGKTMSVRDKGPYWIMYPFDQSGRYQVEVNFSRSVWQLSRLKMLD